MTDRSDNKLLPPWLRGVPLPPRPSEPALNLYADLPAVPVVPTGNMGAENIPDWLSSLTAPDLASSPSVAPSPSEEVQELPAWLTNLSGSIDSTAPVETADSAEDIPDWLRSSEPVPGIPESPLPSQPYSSVPPPTPQGRASGTGGFTGWLSRNNEPSAPPESPAPSTPSIPIKETKAADQLPAWLSSNVSSSSNDASSSESLPDWLQSLEPPVDDSSDTVPAPPSWMNDRSPAAPEPVVPALEETDAPSWLQSSATNMPATGPEADAEGLPNWLQSISDDDIRRVTESDDDDLGIAPFAFDSGAEPPASPEAPSWLASLPAADERPSGEASEWLSANASQLIPAQATPIVPDVPNWLRDAASDDSDEAPAWLRGPEPLTPSASDLTMSPGSAADIPAWLRDTSGPIPEEAQPPQNDDDMPAWLRESGATIAAQTAPILPTTDIVDVRAAPIASEPEQPAWLGDPVPLPTLPTIPSGDLPDWLQSNTPIHPLDAPLPVVPVASDDLPAWLRDTAAPTVDISANSLPPWLRDETGQPMPSAMAPGDINLPTWLRGADTLPAAVPPTASAPPVAQPSSLDWFEDTSKQSSPSTSSELLGGADLPAWLRSETERPRESNPADARSLDWLARLGSYDDDTPLTTSVDAVARLVLPAAPTRTSAQIEALALLRRMASTPLSQGAAAEESAPTTVLRSMSVERVLSLLLLILLIVGLTVPGLATALAGIPFAPSPAAAALLEQIKPLGENDIVLIGYEWDAQRISELRPLERAVIEQLIDQRVKLVLVSTDPQSTMLQFDMRDRLNEANYQGGGLDYVLLGYRPGGEIGLRQLAQNLRGALQSDFQGRDATIGALATNLSTSQPRLSTLNDFAMAIVFADEPTDVQGWMEQIRPAMNKPIAFLVPAGVEPISQPYFRQPGIFSLAGMQGALAYEQLRGGPNIAQTSLQASQLRLATLLFAALLALGLVVVLVGTVVNRPRSQP